MGPKAAGTLIAISFCAQAGQANELGGIRLGMTEQDALRVLRTHGEPQPLSPRISGYRAGAYNFVLCRGLVDNVNHRLQATFMAFARVASRAIAEHGEPADAQISAEETERPVGAITFGWPTGNNYVYQVEYIELDGQPFVNETVAHSVSCNQR